MRVASVEEVSEEMSSTGKRIYFNGTVPSSTIRLPELVVRLRRWMIVGTCACTGRGNLPQTDTISNVPGGHCGHVTAKALFCCEKVYCDERIFPALLDWVIVDLEFHFCHRWWAIHISLWSIADPLVKIFALCCVTKIRFAHSISKVGWGKPE